MTGVQTCALPICSVAEQGIRPAVDLSRTNSSLLTPEIVGDRHYLLSLQVQSLLEKYESLKNIIAIIGENELSVSDRKDYNRAKKLIQSFTQNMTVMESHSGNKGEYFTREQTLQSIEEIVAWNYGSIYRQTRKIYTKAR